MLRRSLKLQLCPVKYLSGVSVLESDARSKVRSLVANEGIKKFLKPNSQSTKDLANIIETTENIKEINAVKNILMRKFKNCYSPLSINIISESKNKLFMKLMLLRSVGKTFDSVLLELAREIINDQALPITVKKEKLYELIEFLAEAHPVYMKKNGWILPSIMHEWFWENIQRNESFQHYHFLIEHKVQLSSCKYIIYFCRRLLLGSEAERNLASFKLFLGDPLQEKKYLTLFKKSYSMETIIMIINNNIKSKDLRYIDKYFSILLKKTESISSGNQEEDIGRMLYADISFIKFSNCLLYYLAATKNVSIFIETFLLNIERINKLRSTDFSSYNGDTEKFNKTLSRESQKAISMLLKIIQENGLQEEMFGVLSFLPDKSYVQNLRFTKHLIGRLLKAIAQFNDSKLLLNYIISSYRSKKTAMIVNKLGLWGHILYNDTKLIEHTTLMNDIKKFERNIVPKTLSLPSVPGPHVLNLLYLVVLTINSKVLKKEEFQNLIIDLYEKYKETMFSLIKGKTYWRSNTSVLGIFLHQIRYVLKDPKLAYNILMDFYGCGLGKKMSHKGTSSVFSLVVYNNHTINMLEINKVLDIMEALKVPLDLKFCIDMVLRNLKKGDTEVAHDWYKKILGARFQIKHMKLIQHIVANNWEFPEDFDMNLLQLLNQEISNNTEEMLFDENDHTIDYNNFKPTILASMHKLFKKDIKTLNS
ncbi:hypothetical protein TPHA_0H01620 [Tetrapisispora phaffii CBS 4417]|uniref:Mitochondrial translation factor ATP22 n=1 Tax=Tetrapisispora phaffii (strain ATCC 24235 / CBS 4417 / NBRC 1672 / NRRL Y-8282 / UCD 70-5) TaxID=1071381 RepID=G8BX64_TETPH|nr:hypothetical protein TPHA_0H01620 [Tetrapisispora phaffii CBS 4417]CCE64368.1 hypothetical protein TPHA_0H01620 [Tetrapisispora phaffii CBS 4417]